MRANKDNSKALIDCWCNAYMLFTHTCTLYKPESLCMHFFSVMLYNVDARMSKTRQC